MHPLLGHAPLQYYITTVNYNELMNYNDYNNEQHIISMPQHKHTLPCPHYQLELCPIG